MKTGYMNCAHSTRVGTLAVLGALLCGCATLGLDPYTIREKTRTTLRLPDSAFTISDRVDTPERTTYLVSTARGKQYNCYVMGTSQSPDGVASNAICSEISPPAKRNP
jgi:hypothetical protein